MARTIKEIHQQIIAEKNAEPSLAGLTSPSKLAVWYGIAYVVAVCHWTLEQLYDEFKAIVNAVISAGKAHTLTWYITKSLAYQHGYNLAEDEDTYDNSLLTESDIEASKVIKYAAAEEVYKGIRIKIAGLSGGDLAPVTTAQLNGFKAYMQLIKDAGVRIYYVNAPADSLKLHLTIYYNALVLDEDGQRIDGTNNTPVQNAVNAFLKDGFKFNGMFILAKLVDALQQVDGIEIPHVSSAEATYGLLPYMPIDVEYKPDGGYLRIINPSDLTLEFIPHAAI